MNEEDDRLWLDGLAGRGVDGAADADGAASSAARREGAVLRDAIRSSGAAGVADASGRRGERERDAVAAIDARREAQLLARARREGLLPPVRSRWPALAAAAALAVLAVGIAWLQRPAPPPAEVVRGASEAVQRVRVADPAAAQAGLVAALRAAGVAARGYVSLDRRGVDADLPQPPTAEVRRILGEWHLAVPEDGVLRVEFAPEPGP